VSTSSSEYEDVPTASSHNHTNHYDLRPNRLTNFPKRKPRYSVDRCRFPHFSYSYKRSLKPHTSPDRDYAPPSHSPTPDSLDRSPSVISSQLSLASSLELFGLEAHSISSPDRGPSATLSQTSGTSSLQFFSSEEHLPTPNNRSGRSQKGEYPMELLHIDVAGPFDEGLDSSRYWLTIVDDSTGWIEIIPILRRQEFVIKSLSFFLEQNERPERKCRRIRLDRIPEQVGEEMKFILFSLAIQAEFTGIDQDGVAERAHKTIYYWVGPTLTNARLPSKFWPEIARTAAFLSNRSPSTKLNTTPYQAWYGEKPDLSRLRVIGSRGGYLVSPKQRKKLTEPRTRPCILLGYERNTNYRILLEDGRIIGTPNAEFHKVFTTPFTQTIEGMGAKQYGPHKVAAAAAGGGRIIGFQNQLPAGIQQASVPASGRQISILPPERALSQSTNDNSQVLPQSSNDNSRVLTQSSHDNSQEHMPPQSSDKDLQPHIAEQEGRTLSTIRSDDTFGPFSDALQRDDSPSNNDQQQDDAR
jgi:hypothetical protein